MNASFLLAIAAIILAPLGAYLVAARQFSGKIKTSDASDLWEESRSIRNWSQGRINELTELVDKLEKRIKTVEETNDTLVLENAHLLQQVDRLKKEAAGA